MSTDRLFIDGRAATLLTKVGFSKNSGQPFIYKHCKQYKILQRFRQFMILNSTVSEARWLKKEI